MLDWAHGLALRAVGEGRGEDSPALRDLVACGFVAEAPDGRGYELTETGRVALEVSKPSRTERWAWRIGAATVALLAVASLADLVAG